jgi:hypothetical protein
MVLYRLADEREGPASNFMSLGSPNGSDHDSIFVPLKFPYNRESVLSTSGDSIFFFYSDSEYPSGMQVSLMLLMIKTSCSYKKRWLERPKDQLSLERHP